MSTHFSAYAAKDEVPTWMEACLELKLLFRLEARTQQTLFPYASASCWVIVELQRLPKPVSCSKCSLAEESSNPECFITIFRQLMFAKL
ncbi:unnamed protein product [Protopolystoma xenopodis]|uniref:Uncharacterized protein n=1 Tax=Protopolystoma xenopodis TaxID=117903 RepID=A0A448XQZ2_9PLAT|nr:unnamed protein product [Protopolystoma xenopodis]